jgi:hypothetical protein
VVTLPGLTQLHLEQGCVQNQIVIGFRHWHSYVKEFSGGCVFKKNGFGLMNATLKNLSR